MTVFAILMPTPQPKLVEEIKRVYPDDYLEITDTQWLVATNDTVLGVSAKLKIADKNYLSLPSSGGAIVFATSSYYGRAATIVWDWIKTKLESTYHG